MTAAEKPTVAVIYGGQSTEHSVSCISAGAIIDHLDTEAFNVLPIGITRAGAWVPGATDTEDLRAKGENLPVVPEGEEKIQPVFAAQNGGAVGDGAVEFRYSAGPRTGELFAVADVLFPVLHGELGEDGTIQGLFDLLGARYVGNGVLASAAGMDKEYTKRLAREANIPTGPEAVLYRGEQLSDSERERLGLPLFIKPARGGSSIGISKVDTPEQLQEALDLAFAHDEKVIVEAMQHGPEVECGVLQKPDGSIIASVPALLEGTEDGEEGFYGFDAKYLDDTVSASIPAPLDAELTSRIQELAVATFRALGCEGLARVDFFVTDAGPVLNEINTMPGFTPISMYPQMFLASGMSYPELLSTLVNGASRHGA